MVGGVKKKSIFRQIVNRLSCSSNLESFKQIIIETRRCHANYVNQKVIREI